MICEAGSPRARRFCTFRPVQTFTYSGPASSLAGSNDPTLYNEFIVGLLCDGTCLLDGVRVMNVSTGNTQVILDEGFAPAMPASGG